MQARSYRDRGVRRRGNEGGRDYREGECRQGVIVIGV